MMEEGDQRWTVIPPIVLCTFAGAIEDLCSVAAMTAFVFTSA